MIQMIRACGLLLFTALIMACSESDNTRAGYVEGASDEAPFAHSNDKNNEEIKKEKKLTEAQKDQLRSIVSFVRNIETTIPPATDPSLLTHQHNEMTKVIRKFNAIPINKDLSKNCKTFRNRWKRVSSQLATHSKLLITERNEDKSLFRMARIKILSSQLLVLKNLLDGGQAAGADVLTTDGTTDYCDINPETEEYTLVAGIVDLSQERILAIFGHEPISVSQFISTLENQKLEEHKAEATRSAALLVGSILVSIVLWQFMLAKLTIAAGLFSVSKAVIMVPSLMILGAAEMSAFTYIDRNYVRAESTWTQSVRNQQRYSVNNQAEWNQIMDQTNSFLNKSLKSPIIYAQFIWAEHNARLQRYKRTLEEFRPQLEYLENKYGSMEAAITAIERGINE